MVPLSQDIIVYRGTQSFTDIKNNSFISTTIEEDIARGFMKEHSCCLFTLLIRGGGKFVPILDNSFFGGEGEILLPPNSTFQMEGGILIYHPPQSYPVIELSNWDKYILRVFSKTTSEEFGIDQLEDVLVKEYMPSLVTLITSENLIERI